MKPLRARAYGHIPHLPGSRLGVGDHHCHEGQAAIATLKKRDKNDKVTVTVKLDGSCMAVAKISGEIVPLSRAGYLASTSKYEQHQMFSDYVGSLRSRFGDVLAEGERFVGEWLAQAHGTRYELNHEPFVVFDLMVGPDRLPNDEMLTRTFTAGLMTPYQISSKGDPMSIESALEAIGVPKHGEVDPVEGAVWRVERNGEFDFLCKFVRPEKVDGRFLPEVSGSPEIWNWKPR